ncbi:cell division ATP-binding protein FtsE [Chthonomonas calidirosea]|uniref:Cell division ATP-binding protein FtsE n=1 Tax=Chthonomonas calidirosea (strain DSM 23976 / ICMP 18418 / T49) TaxID=1303518 RepID=S0ES41_CHTCT|nr:cell division ATP-binding protein FtsE [Chthonomonas calidirosea]CCW33926.1 cell division ATP-binding protein FtsE [Chthonomonas calidirosea T49]CEK16261.1 cell division ATP-binding protein FtsE [Chthonomonas calidirosea]
MIELRNVSVIYPEGVPALSHINFCVKRGEFVFVVGPSGAGKSTLLKLLYRAEVPTQGEVTVDGICVSRLRPRDIPFFRRRLGVVFQDFGLLPDRTVYENVAFALRVIGAGRSQIRQRVPAVLEMVGLASRPDAFPHQLSGGEQQRVAIARALVNEPHLLLADEPTGNLDPETSAGIVDLLAYINAQKGTTVVVATHDVAIVNRLQRRVLEFSDGRLVRDDSQGAYATVVMREDNEAR